MGKSLPMEGPWEYFIKELTFGMNYWLNKYGMSADCSELAESGDHNVELNRHDYCSCLLRV